MKKHTITKIVFAPVMLALMLSVSACSGDDDADDPDHAHLMFVTAPPTTLTAGTDVEVRWAVHTEGDLHHTEVRGCMGQDSTCGLGGSDSFDAFFSATMVEGEYMTTINVDTPGEWSIVVYAHVGETPHISDVMYVTVEAGQ